MQARVMSEREKRGAALAKDKRIKQIVAHKWLVPSQSGPGSYLVDGLAGTCACPDYEERRDRCKHQWAVAYARHEVREDDGTVTVTETMRISYAQNWRSYNLAQTAEKEHVGELLRALCSGIVQPAHERGRPRLPLADVVHAAAMKVYTGMSGRRATTDIRECESKGLIDHAPHYNTVHNFMERTDVAPLLRALVEESASPLKAIESNFAVDSTGFSTSTYARWFDHKYGREMREQTWIKCHAMIGTLTNVVVSVEATAGTVSDCPVLPQLVNGAVARGFRLAEVSADKGYLANYNLESIEKAGAVPYIPFKINSQGEGPEAWQRLWHLYSFRKSEFLAHYHQRSNVESTFSMIKRKFGAAVRAKLLHAQINEVLLKVLVHNLAVLVHSMHELGVQPTF